MRAETLYDAITGVRDELVDEAARIKPAKKHIPWRTFGALAAAAVLAVGAGGWAAARLGGMSMSGPGVNLSPGGDGEGGGHDDGSTTFMSYAGPVLPLTTREGGEGLTAARELTYDFSPWTPEGGHSRSSTDLLVTDSYTLTNPTEEERTVTLLYPFVSSLYSLSEDLPELTADGAAMDTVLRAGGYSGGFQAVAGSSSDALLNLDTLHSWEQYRALLSDGRYLEQALEGWPDLSGVPVTVYKFFDYWGPEPDERAGHPNPSIRAGFSLDYNKTTVLSYGFHGASWNWEAGTMIQEFSIPQSFNPWYGEPYYLFVVGDDIENLTVGGYVTGGTDPDTEPLPECRVEVEHSVTDLESALRTAAELMYRTYQSMNGTDGPPDFELYFGLMKDFLLSYGPLAESGVARYQTGWLEELDFTHVDRVFYLEAQVAIPAGGSVTVEARLVKPPSYDFYCAHTENRGVCGYDMTTRLGSNLEFTAQTAAAVNTQAVEIVRQNYGFDWDNGVNAVALDLGVEHYYLEVRRAAEP